jgi:hypothetical protein
MERIFFFLTLVHILCGHAACTKIYYHWIGTWTSWMALLSWQNPKWNTEFGVLLLIRPLSLLCNLRQLLGFTPLNSSLFLTQLGYNSMSNYGPMTHNFVCKDYLVSKQIHLSTFHLHSWYWYVRFECEVFVMVLFATYKFSLGDFHFHVWEWYGGNHSYAKLNSEAECSYSLFLAILWTCTCHPWQEM